MREAHSGLSHTHTVLGGGDIMFGSRSETAHEQWLQTGSAGRACSAASARAVPNLRKHNCLLQCIFAAPTRAQTRGVRSLGGLGRINKRQQHVFNLTVYDQKEEISPCSEWMHLCEGHVSQVCARNPIALLRWSRSWLLEITQHGREMKGKRACVSQVSDESV